MRQDYVCLTCAFSMMYGSNLPSHTPTQQLETPIYSRSYPLPFYCSETMRDDLITVSVSYDSERK